MTHTLTLPIPRPLLTTNQARSQHWRKAYRAKNETEQLVRSALVLAPISTLTAPQTVLVTWYAPDARRRDSDALDCRCWTLESKRGRERANAHRPLTHSLEPNSRRG